MQIEINNFVFIEEVRGVEGTEIPCRLLEPGVPSGDALQHREGILNIPAFSAVNLSNLTKQNKARFLNSKYSIFWAPSSYLDLYHTRINYIFYINYVLRFAIYLSGIFAFNF